jgi:hypothetical protein
MNPASTLAEVQTCAQVAASSAKALNTIDGFTGKAS